MKSNANRWGKVMWLTLAVLVIISLGGLIPDLVKQIPWVSERLSGQRNWGWTEWTITVLLLVIVTWAIGHSIHSSSEMAKVYRLSEKSLDEQKQAIIYLISTPNKFRFDVAQGPGDPVIIRDEKNENPIILGIDNKGLPDLDRFIEDLKTFNVAQVIRSLKGHRDKLKFVCLIGSEGDQGSHQYLDPYQKFLEKLFPHLQVYVQSKKPNFNQLDAVEGALFACLSVLRTRGFKDKDIVIDVTGGTKTASIAGATMTFEHQYLEFQYVQMESPHTIKMFNLVTKTDPKA